jgi:hypothetical protein
MCKFNDEPNTKECPVCGTVYVPVEVDECDLECPCCEAEKQALMDEECMNILCGGNTPYYEPLMFDPDEFLDDPEPPQDVCQCCGCLYTQFEDYDICPDCYIDQQEKEQAWATDRTYEEHMELYNKGYIGVDTDDDLHGGSPEVTYPGDPFVYDKDPELNEATMECMCCGKTVPMSDEYNVCCACYHGQYDDPFPGNDPYTKEHIQEDDDDLPF